jgi:hypothetical protein
MYQFGTVEQRIRRYDLLSVDSAESSGKQPELAHKQGLQRHVSVVIGVSTWRLHLVINHD